jgi:hypothetical protein
MMATISMFPHAQESKLSDQEQSRSASRGYARDVSGFTGNPNCVPAFSNVLSSV